MATTTTQPPARELYAGESFRVFVIRRGWSFWDGRKFGLGPYDAKVFSSCEAARDTIRRLDLRGNGGDLPCVRKCTLTLN